MDISGSIKTIFRSCPCCGLDNSCGSLSRYSSPPWAVRVCAECGFVYIDSYPKYEHLAEEMDWVKTWSAEDKRRKKRAVYKLDALTRWRLKLGKPRAASFIRRQISSGKVLDLGCGNGNREIAGNFEPYGIEISSALAKNADSFSASMVVMP